MKRGQLSLSFGMIFSIILMIIFIAFAFYAIEKFLGIQRSGQIGIFINDFQTDIDKMWKSVGGSQQAEYSLPSRIDSVCFVDYSSGNKGSNQKIYNELKVLYYTNENLFFYPVGSGEGLDAVSVEHLNIQNSTMKENPLCIKNIKGKVSMVIKKNYDEGLVTIARE